MTVGDFACRLSDDLRRAFVCGMHAFFFGRARESLTIGQIKNRGDDMTRTNDDMRRWIAPKICC